MSKADLKTFPTEDAARVGNDIATAAYRKYVDRGRIDGHDVADWFAAEEELRTLAPPEPHTSRGSVSEPVHPRELDHEPRS